MKLTLLDRVFLNLYCHPPPGRPAKSDESNSGEPLATYLAVFGPSFHSAIRDKVVLDIGCGHGHQVVALAECGARTGIGLEARPIFQPGEDRARALGLDGRVKFTLTTMEEMEAASIDVALSQNSFEHYQDPGNVLRGALRLLRPGGRFFITFSPPWLNPFGVHMFYMIKYPWAHFIFPESTIMRVRRLYRSDNAERFEDVEGGLNRMTIRKFLRSVALSGFDIEKLIVTPIRGTPAVLAHLPGIREFVSSRVSAILVKPAR